MLIPRELALTPTSYPVLYLRYPREVWWVKSVSQYVFRKRKPLFYRKRMECFACILVISRHFYLSTQQRWNGPKQLQPWTVHVLNNVFDFSLQGKWIWLSSRHRFRKSFFISKSPLWKAFLNYQSSKRRPPWSHSSTLFRKSWVFSDFLPQGKLTGWVRINS